MAKNTKTYILIFLIIVLGLFLRIYNIENAPPGVYPDEAVNGMDALTAIDTGEWQWFYPANNGREGLFMNLIALCFKFFGVSVLTLKLPSIIFGTLAIIGTYLLGKELFGKRAGPISGFLVATSFWAINFSHISFRANMLPAVLVFSFYFLWRGMRTQKWLDFAVSGLIFGIGLHTYISFRIAPVVLIAMFFVFLFTRQKFLRDYWKLLGIFAATTLLTASPMLYTFLVSHPEYFSSRSTSISIFSPEVNQGDLLGTFAKSFGLSLVKYNFWGDQNWRHNYPPYAILDPAIGIAFTFGFLYCLVHAIKFLFAYTRSSVFWEKSCLRGEFFSKIFLRQPSNEEKFRQEKSPSSYFFQKTDDRKELLEKYVFLLSWFFLLNAPEFLTAEGNPHALRSIGTLPVTFIFSALTFEYFFEKAKRQSEFFGKIVFSLGIFVILLSGIFNAVKYHIFWAKNPKTAESFEKNLMDISSYLKTQSEQEKIYIFAESMQRIPLQVFNWNRPNTEYFYFGEKESFSPQEKNFQIILTNHDNETVEYLEKKFPFIKMNEIKNEFGMTYYILK